MARRTELGPRAVAPGPREVEVLPGVSYTVKRKPNGLLEVCFYDGRETDEQKFSPLELFSSHIGSVVLNKRGFFQPFTIQPGDVVGLWDRQKPLRTQVVS